MATKFKPRKLELKRNKKGKHYWNLPATNGRTLAGPTEYFNAHLGNKKNFIATANGILSFLKIEGYNVTERYKQAMLEGRVITAASKKK
jgi:uncharacterized protein YegP (UPF0339 family)